MLEGRKTIGHREKDWRHLRQRRLFMVQNRFVEGIDKLHVSLRAKNSNHQVCSVDNGETSRVLVEIPGEMPSQYLHYEFSCCLTVAKEISVAKAMLYNLSAVPINDQVRSHSHVSGLDFVVDAVFHLHTVREAKGCHVSSF